MWEDLKCPRRCSAYGQPVIRGHSRNYASSCLFVLSKGSRLTLPNALPLKVASQGNKRGRGQNIEVQTYLKQSQWDPNSETFFMRKFLLHILSPS